MPDLKYIIFLVGALLVALGLAMLLPALEDIIHHNQDWLVFITSGGITLFCGLGFMMATRGADKGLTLKQAFLTTVVSWVALPLFAALPFLLFGHKVTFTDSFFEAMSGLTTTGATIFTGLDSLPPGILLWRSILQWIGGIGIIVMAIAVLPMLKVGGMQLFQTESSDTSEKILPRISQMTGGITAAYLTISVLCFISLMLAGMTPFEAVNHTMTAVSTGGFSTSDQSISHFDSAVIDYVLVFFMIISCLPYVLYIQMAQGRPFKLWQDDQVKTFAILLALMALIISTWLWVVRDFDLASALRFGIFNTVSLITTTGYASTAYDGWGQFALVFFFFITFLGGCAGSSTGGVKAYRIRILFLRVWTTLKRLSIPNAIFHPKFNGTKIPERVATSVMSFLLMFAVSFIVISLLLALTGLDLVSSLSGSLTALANTGPGLGTIIGPTGNYSSLPDVAKWILAFAMMLGRLELMTVLVIFTPTFWRS